MNDDTDSRSRWFAPWRRADRTPHEDAADLGTAFGLDLSLAPTGEPLPVPQRGEHWYDRLMSRRD